MREDRASWLKGSLLLLMLIAAVVALRSDAVRPLLGADALRALLDDVGPWAPLLFVLMFALLCALPFPGSALVIAGAALFGFWRGLGLSLVGAIIGATLAFFLARTLGRDLARRAAGDLLRRYDDRLTKNGFRTVLYLRLLMLPFAPVNYAAGLSGIRARDYITATAVGLIPSMLFLTFFTAAIRGVALEYGLVSWETLHALARWDVLLAFAALVVAFTIPHLLARRWNKTKRKSTVSHKKRKKGPQERRR